MKISRHYLQLVLGVVLGVALCAPDVEARGGGGGGGSRGGGSRGGGSRGGGSRPSSSSRSNAARSGRGTVSHSSSRSSTPSRMSQQHASAFNSGSSSSRPTTSGPSKPSTPVKGKDPRTGNSSSKSRTGLAVAAGAAGASALHSSRQEPPGGYGSIKQSERLKTQVRQDPAARKAVSDRLASDPAARRAATQQLQTSPEARAAARATSASVPATRTQAQSTLTSSGHRVHTQLPAHTRPVRVRPRPGYRHHHRHHTYYWSGHRWYRPYYYGGYVYYEEDYVPYGAELDELPEDECEIVVIEGVTYYLLEGVYYEKTASGYVVSDPYADEDAVAMDDANSKAIQVLRKMSEYQETVTNFRLMTDETHDNLIESGERVQLTNTRRLFVSKPDKVRAETQGDGINRQFWYDGKTVSVYSAVLNSFATVDAPNTLPEMVTTMATEYGFSFPLADVLFSDVFYALSSEITTADYVGEHRVGNVLCDHLAFSQDTIDWQIWVEKSDKPIPRKIQISYKLEPGTPVYTVEIHDWSEITEKASAYTFKPPKDSVEIDMEPL